jgi:hypothetical protein
MHPDAIPHLAIEGPKHPDLLPKTACEVLDNPKKYEKIPQIADVAKRMKKMAEIVDEYEFASLNPGYVDYARNTLNELDDILKLAIEKGGFPSEAAQAKLAEMVARAQKLVHRRGGRWKGINFTLDDTLEKRVAVLAEDLNPTRRWYAEQTRLLLGGSVSPAKPAAAPAKDGSDAPDASIAA